MVSGCLNYRLGILHIVYMYKSKTNTSECMYMNSNSTKLAIFFKTFQTDFYVVDTSWWLNCIHQLSRSFVTPLHCQHCKTRNWSPSAGECFQMWVLTTSACIRCQWPVWVTGESPYYRHHNTDTTHEQSRSRTGTAFLPQRLRAYQGQGDFLIKCVNLA